MVVATRLSAVKPIRKQSRAWDDAVVGLSARCIAAPSSTARRPTSHENHGSGDRKSKRTGYVVWLSATPADHSSHWA